MNLELFRQFCKSKQKQFHILICKKTRKSTSGQSSKFGLNLSCILLAVWLLDQAQDLNKKSLAFF